MTTVFNVQTIGALTGAIILVLVTVYKLFFSNNGKEVKCLGKCPDPKCHEIVIRLDERSKSTEDKMDVLFDKFDKFDKRLDQALSR